MFNYWQRRMARRRILAAGTAGLGVGALALVGCGGGGGDDGGGTSGSSLITELSDSSRQAKRGGIFSNYVTGDETNLDPLTTPRGTGYGGPARMAYMRLFREKEVPGGTAKPEFLGDLADSWELTDGGTRLSIRIRQDVKFDARAPTNGRVLDVDDVIFSWKRIISSSPYATQLYHGSDPASAVETIEKVDNRTVVMKMAFPWVPLMPNLASGVLMIAPREAEDKFDLKNTVRGSGPWRLENHTPSVHFQWRRNSNYYLKDVPFLDGYNDPIISEGAAQQAAFRAKQLDGYTPSVQDVLSLARELSGVKLYQNRLGPNVHQLMFGSQPNSVFRDIRVRRAASMAIDRELYAEVDTNAKEFSTNGIPYDITLDSHLTAQYKDAGLWLDPRGKEIGEGGRYFNFDVAEAKKLLAAAGFPNGVDSVMHYSNRGQGPQVEAEKTSAMLTEAGIRLKLQAADYQTVWLPIIYVSPADGKGQYEGVGIGGSTSSLPEPVAFIYVRLHSKGAFTGGRAWDKDSIETDATIEKALKELDDGKRRGLIHDIQRQMALTQSTVSYGQGYRAHSLAWPWVRNWGFQASWNNAGSTEPYKNVWIDETQRTS